MWFTCLYTWLKKAHSYEQQLIACGLRSESFLEYLPLLCLEVTCYKDTDMETFVLVKKEKKRRNEEEEKKNRQTIQYYRKQLAQDRKFCSNSLMY